MSDPLCALLQTPLALRGRVLPTRLALAPMAGLGHVALRQVIRSFGSAGLAVSEMCNARAVPQENRWSSSVFRWMDEEAENLVVQIFGNEPEVMADAAQRIEAEGLLGVDINMGCSVAALCKKGYGAALLKDPDRAYAVVRAVRRAVSCPVMVKFRTGWQTEVGPAVALAKRFEDAGADLLTFHPRVAPDRRSRPPRWEQITAVSQAVRIPVFGNGNVFSRANCLQMLQETGCAGVSLGRIAVARPWIFAAFMRTLPFGHEIFAESALRVVDALWTHFPPAQALRLYKKYAVYLAANFTYGHQLRKLLVKGEDKEAVQAGILRVLGERPQVAATPHAFLFTS